LVLIVELILGTSIEKWRGSNNTNDRANDGEHRVHPEYETEEVRNRPYSLFRFRGFFSCETRRWEEKSIRRKKGNLA